MIVVGIVNVQGFEAALTAARDEGVTHSYPGLAAPLDGILKGWVSEAWESIEKALRDAFTHGSEYSRQALDAAVTRAEQLIQDAGIRARDVRQALLAKIQAYMSQFVDAALSQVRGTVQAGNTQLELDALEISQSVSLTGSIKASLSEIVGLTSEGQLSVTASYRAPK